MKRLHKWLIIVGILGFAAALIALQLSAVVQQTRSKTALRDLGAFVRDDSDLSGETGTTPTWIESWLGEAPFADVIEVNCIHDYADGSFQRSKIRGITALEHLRNFPRLRRLHLTSNQITDDGLSILEQLPQLEELYLHDADQLGELGFKRVASCSSLRVLAITEAKAPADAVQGLARLEKLERLVLQGCALDDRGLESIAKCQALEELYLGYGPLNVSDDGILALDRLEQLKVLEIRGMKVSKSIQEYFAKKGLEHLVLE